MIKYTLAFLKRGNELLMLNREKGSWMGRWNGVGGKIENGETGEQCVLREIQEETGIQLSTIEFKGNVYWYNPDGTLTGGMHLFLAELPETFEYITPYKVNEGILDWKTVDWIMHPENEGIANNQYFLPTILNEEAIYNFHFIYDGNTVIDFYKEKLPSFSRSV